MIGLDTKVLVPYLTQDDPIQAAKANKLIKDQLTSLHPSYSTISPRPVSEIFSVQQTSQM